eukprot:Clim_evm9s155 gene=Clim_evmTU9s155
MSRHLSLVRQMNRLFHRTGTWQTARYTSASMPQLKPPEPPAPELCCMSGCRVCVWDQYALDVEEYNKKVKEMDRTVDMGPATPASVAMDPGMKAFLEMERKMAKADPA